MRFAGAVVGTSRVIAALGLVGVGALHAAWASGSSWPARSRRELAEAVVGSDAAPAPLPTAVVAVAATAAGIVAGGALGDRSIAVAGRRAAGAALLARAVVGGPAACRVLGLPEPSDRFRDLDARVYRPLCVVLGVAAILGARRPSGRQA
ncbi:DUF3995 domain-containing protein [Agromyces lapidis]|uniref:DUF3995 domain-containing protein n=1 Tax=Agromyces lapidis TaxID=279574 RepID=A0ABV5SS80_9MICO|nr:DUF3995 domain-containing protein [Agromyces lapidis]